MANKWQSRNLNPENLTQELLVKGTVCTLCTAWLHGGWVMIIPLAPWESYKSLCIGESVLAGSYGTADFTLLFSKVTYFPFKYRYLVIPLIIIIIVHFSNGYWIPGDIINTLHILIYLTQQLFVTNSIFIIFFSYIWRSEETILYHGKCQLSRTGALGPMFYDFLILSSQDSELML